MPRVEAKTGAASLGAPAREVRPRRADPSLSRTPGVGEWRDPSDAQAARELREGDARSYRVPLPPRAARRDDSDSGLPHDGQRTPRVTEPRPARYALPLPTASRVVPRLRSRGRVA